jgi:hypothetical protein
MNGLTLSREVRELINESSTSGFIDSMLTYDYLYEAACQFYLISQFATGSTTVTTVDGTASYILPYNFGRLYMKNPDGQYFLKLNDGTDDYWLTYKPYEETYYTNYSDEVAIPYNFSIVDYDQIANDTGTATSTAAASAGEATLTDTAATFTTSNITVGDYISNTTDGSTGYVMSVTSKTVLVAALFGGTANDWTSGDAYVITPKARYALLISPTPSTSAYTITVPYIEVPDPVYSDYRRYNLPSQYKSALVKYAVWLYKYRDREPNFGDLFYKIFDQQARRAKVDRNHASLSKGFKVRFKRPN